MSSEITFEQLNIGWNAEPNAPELQIKVVGTDVVIEFYLDAYLYTQFREGDKARIVFHDCFQYRNGDPNDEGFYSYGQSRFKKYGVKWGEFYRVQNSKWEKEFPDPVMVSETKAERNHYLFYFRDETFECIAASYTMEIIPASHEGG